MKRVISVTVVGTALLLCAAGLSAKELETSKSAEVEAEASAVWALLVDADKWAEWNPAVKSSKLIEGNGEEVDSKVRFVPIIGDKKAPLPIRLAVAKSEKPEKLEYKAKIAGIDILFGFALEAVEGKEGMVKVTSYEKITGAATGLFASIFTQEGLDKEHQVWVDSIKKKLEAKGCGCKECPPDCPHRQK